MGVILLAPLFNVSTTKAAENDEHIVAVTSLTSLYNKDDPGNFTVSKSRSLVAMSTWYSDQSYTHQTTSKTYYRVSTNEWVESTPTLIVQTHNYKMDAQVDNYQNINAKVIQINDQAAPIYNDFGVKTDQTVPANSTSKVDMSYMVGIPGLDSFASYQRIGNNAWIRLDKDGNVIERI